MHKVFLCLFALSILACTPTQKKASNEGHTLVILGNQEVFYQQNLLTLDDLDTYLKDFGHEILNIQINQFVSIGDVTDVTEKLRELSIKRITISDKSTFTILHFEIIGDGNIMINDEVISLSALESNLGAINTDKKLFSFISIKDGAPMGDVMFAKKLIHRNLKHVKYKKADS